MKLAQLIGVGVLLSIAVSACAPEPQIVYTTDKKLAQANPVPKRRAQYESRLDNGIATQIVTVKVTGGSRVCIVANNSASDTSSPVMDCWWEWDE